jgi:hypothetical protein
MLRRVLEIRPIVLVHVVTIHQPYGGSVAVTYRHGHLNCAAFFTAGLKGSQANNMLLPMLAGSEPGH